MAEYTTITRPQNLLFPSVGYGYDNQPVYKIAMANPDILQLHLFYSDEEHREKDRVPTVQNQENILEYYSRSDIPVTWTGLDYRDFVENTYAMAAHINRIEKAS